MAEHEAHVHDFDFLVIGAGSAGVRACRVAASLGAKVAVVERSALGGTCVNLGCIPKKLMVYGAHFADEVHDAAAFGWRVDRPVHDWQTLIANKDREIARLNGVYQSLLEDRGACILRGRAVVRGPHHVEVHWNEGGAETFSARTILVATGGRPERPRMPGAEHALVSDDIFRLTTMPRRILIMGGGYIAVEFASIFTGYGANVTLVHRGPRFLRGFDRDLRVHLDMELRKRGIDIRFKVDVASISKEESGALTALLSSGARIEVDAVLAAIGRVPQTADLGLQAAGVAMDEHGAVKVDDRFRTSVPSIFAVGDVIDRLQLTPVALAEGAIVARNLFGGTDLGADYRAIPSAVFSNPPIATVGLTEEEALAELGQVDVYRSSFTPLKATLTGGPEKTLVKLVVERGTGRVAGVHMVGPDAAEIIQGFAVALKCGATKAQLDATIGIHPTAAEEFVTMREALSAQDGEHGESVAGEAPRRRFRG